MATFCTDAGHGGRDSGASWHNMLEKDLNLIYTTSLNTTLKKRGHKVYTTREQDINVPSLSTRCRLVNVYQKQNAPAFDAIISVHCNVAAYIENGVYKAKSDRHGFYAIYSQESQKSTKLAETIAQQCDAASVQLNHGGMLSTVQLGRSLAWIHKTTPTAVLLELGFMTNPEELALLKSVDYRAKMVEALAQGIEKYLSI